ncbi:hypothetical protein BDK51DRAFT_33357 [Blyttiomyces helicus]|uniref:Uncharacterized protein n=1 Tax=Blyttiomyces helicus TaxID=388810 RepID=A0A4P9WT84_9FUNG|nr:hypothetical protein BDK51DRAFT_33357 [Blyttiomyces helicus]|eukprot:RKO94266.1 hypothetical protein BDK51DRAFT_33357 [Blyttiomyces helicus]
MYIILIFSFFAGVWAQFDLDLPTCQYDNSTAWTNKTFSVIAGKTFFDPLMMTNNATWYSEYKGYGSTPSNYTKEYVLSMYESASGMPPIEGSFVNLSIPKDVPSCRGNATTKDGGFQYCICSYTWNPAGIVPIGNGPNPDQTFQKCFPCEVYSTSKNRVNMRDPSSGQINLPKLYIPPPGSVHPGIPNVPNYIRFKHSLKNLSSSGFLLTKTSSPYDPTSRTADHSYRVNGLIVWASRSVEGMPTRNVSVGHKRIVSKRQSAKEWRETWNFYHIHYATNSDSINIDDIERSQIHGPESGGAVRQIRHSSQNSIFGSTRHQSSLFAWIAVLVLLASNVADVLGFPGHQLQTRFNDYSYTYTSCMDGWAKARQEYPTRPPVVHDGPGDVDGGNGYGFGYMCRSTVNEHSRYSKPLKWIKTDFGIHSKIQDRIPKTAPIWKLYQGYTFGTSTKDIELDLMYESINSYVPPALVAEFMLSDAAVDPFLNSADGRARIHVNLHAIRRNMMLNGIQIENQPVPVLCFHANDKVIDAYDNVVYLIRDGQHMSYAEAFPREIITDNLDAQIHMCCSPSPMGRMREKFKEWLSHNCRPEIQYNVLDPFYDNDRILEAELRQSTVLCRFICLYTPCYAIFDLAHTDLNGWSNSEYEPDLNTPLEGIQIDSHKKSMVDMLVSIRGSFEIPVTPNGDMLRAYLCELDLPVLGCTVCIVTCKIDAADTTSNQCKGSAMTNPYYQTNCTVFRLHNLKYISELNIWERPAIPRFRDESILSGTPVYDTTHAHWYKQNMSRLPGVVVSTIINKKKAAADARALPKSPGCFAWFHPNVGPFLRILQIQDFQPPRRKSQRDTIFTENPTVEIVV